MTPTPRAGRGRELRERPWRPPDLRFGALYQRESGTLLIGCLPLLVQLPFFSIMYRLFLSPTVAGQPNQLLAHLVAGVPLSAHVLRLSWLDHGSVGSALGVTGLFSVHGLVFAGLIALLALVGWASVRLAKRMSQAATVPAPAIPASPAARKKQARAGQARAGQAPAAAAASAADTQGRAIAALSTVLPYFTAVVALFVPLAAGIYLLTTTAWTLAERTALRHRAQEAADRSAAARARTAVS